MFEPGSRKIPGGYADRDEKQWHVENQTTKFAAALRREQKWANTYCTVN